MSLNSSNSKLPTGFCDQHSSFVGGAITSLSFFQNPMSYTITTFVETKVFSVSPFRVHITLIKEVFMNIHQKILKIADAAGILQKTKEGYGYKYVPEEEIQAKVTGSMQELGVMLYCEIVPGTLKVTPHFYEKVKYVRPKDGKGEAERQVTPVNEVIVSADVVYTWVNAEKPEEKVVVPWVFVGQMDDASQAFGAAATYCNRYMLMKSLQLATTEADPDQYRSKQREAAGHEEKKEADKVKEAVDALVEKGKELIAAGFTNAQIKETIGKHNDGNQNARSIKAIETCALIMKDFEAMKEKK
jgi:hypothetical protein